jgi:hypothetical protein
MRKMCERACFKRGKRDRRLAPADLLSIEENLEIIVKLR